MVNFYSDDNVTLQFRIVRAFGTPEAVREQYGILANFSAKTVLVNGDKEVELMSHNSLMLTVRSNRIYISSPYKQDTWNDKAGNSVQGPKVFYTTLFPLSYEKETDDDYERYDQFVQQVIIDIKEFIEKKKEEARERKFQDSPQNVVVPF